MRGNKESHSQYNRENRGTTREMDIIQFDLYLLSLGNIRPLHVLINHLSYSVIDNVILHH